MNASLGNVGKTVYYTEPLEVNPTNGIESLSELVTDIRAGKVEFLMIVGGNPVYEAPADLEFLSALKQVKLRVHSGLYDDETAEWCQWHIPATHYLEMWGDARAYDGTISLIQPLIQPLYDNHSAYEILATLTKDAGKSGFEMVQGYWQSQHPEKEKSFTAYWEKSLHDGVMAGTALPAISVSPRSDLGREAAGSSVSGLELVFRPDPTIFGIAEAQYETHMGQRGDDQPNDGAVNGPEQGRLRKAASGRTRSRSGRAGGPGPRG
jgi:molybdopterin-containing oxidoreductase family iron-sulfur binding subunit